jgi:hypothetical protein
MPWSTLLTSTLVIGLAACGTETSVDPESPQPDSVSLEPVRDNTIYEEGASLSNGAGQHLFAGVPGEPGRRRGLVRFDVAGAGIPLGATIDSVKVTLSMSRTSAGPKTVSLHRVTADWGEGTSVASMGEGGGAPAAAGDATWLHRFFDGSRWTTPGGDYSSTASAGTSVGAAGLYRWGSTSRLVADVESWLTAPAGNLGWIVVGDESGTGTAKRFDSRQNADVSKRPKLTVYFERPR